MAAPVVHRLSDGPPPAHTGGFGEPTCSQCHQPPATSRSPTLTLSGLPASFEPGRSYEIEIASRAPNLTRAGFELSARFDRGSDLAAHQAGLLSAALDPQRVGFTFDSTRNVVYAHHTLEGTWARPAGANRWRVRWTAPVQRHTVVFHAASVIASDDNSPLDDEVLTTSVLVPAAIPTSP